MAATTEDRNTVRREGNLQPVPVAAGAVIPAGVLVGSDANGNAENATATSGRVLGVSDERVDNTGGAAGDKSVVVRKSVYQFENSVGSPVTQAHIGQQAIVEDNQTVAAPDGATTPAGQVWAVDGGGVWVDTEHVDWEDNAPSV